MTTAVCAPWRAFPSFNLQLGMAGAVHGRFNHVHKSAILPYIAHFIPYPNCKPWFPAFTHPNDETTCHMFFLFVVCLNMLAPHPQLSLQVSLIQQDRRWDLLQGVTDIKSVILILIPILIILILVLVVIPALPQQSMDYPYMDSMDST